MSLESALEEERLEILKLLDRPPRRPSGARSTPASPRQGFSPLHTRTTSPHRPPVSSLIDAIAGPAGAASAPPPRHSTPVSSGRSSPIDLAVGGADGLYRTRSDTNGGVPRFLGRNNLPPAHTPNTAYDFSMSPSVGGSAAKKRTSSQPSSMLDPLLFPQRSKSPLGRPAFSHHGRATSPRGAPPVAGHLSASAPSAPIPEYNHLIMTDSGHMLDPDYAYAKLNDDALAASGGALSTLPERRPVTDKQGEAVRAGFGESITQDGGVRLQKDVNLEDSAMLDSSDDDSSDDGDDGDDDDDDDDSSPSFSEGEGGGRGRGGGGRRRGRGRGDDGDEDDDEDDDDEAEENRGRPGVRGRFGFASGPASSRGSNSEWETAVGLDPGGGSSRSKRKKKKKAKKTAKNGNSGKKRTMSLLAAAEEERMSFPPSLLSPKLTLLCVGKQVSKSSKYNVRSLLPSISVTPSPSTAGLSSAAVRRSGVHPSTAFDVPSLASTPVSSDQEADDLDIRRAQRMETAISPILSSPDTHRVVRTIVRGDYEAAKKQRSRSRKYLVATDLSSEAQYAMEWTIGTVLRDGDTLRAICAVDHDTIEDGSKPVSESSIGEALMGVNSQAQAQSQAPVQTQAQTPTQAQADVGSSLGSPSPSPPAVSLPIHIVHTPGTSSPLKEGVGIGGGGSGSGGGGGGPERSRERTKAERERYVAAEAITALVTKLLKKTRLQVKVVIEVIHCKSPKHLLTEIVRKPQPLLLPLTADQILQIDLVEPTLVVLGSRGRSALKGWGFSVSLPVFFVWSS